MLVRANFDNARYWGLEHSLTADLGHGLMARTAFTYIRGEDVDSTLPPNIEVVTVAGLFADAIRSIHDRTSVSSLFLR